MNIKTYFNREEIKKRIDPLFKMQCSSADKIIIFLLVVYISFYRYFEDIFDEKIVRNFLSSFEDNIFTRIVFIAVIFYLIYSICRSKINNYKISKLKRTLSFIVLFFWIYYRFFSGRFIYVEFYRFSWLYYIDLIGMWSISIIIRSFVYKRGKRFTDKNKGLRVDLPITKKSEDTLVRDPFAKQIAEKLINTKMDQEAFSLGIVSQWGNGKTSFINLLCNHLDGDQTIIIKFNPWLYGKERNLIDAFFLQLSQNLKVYDSSLSTELREYSHILSSSNSTLLNIGAKLFENFESKDIQARFYNIRKTIKNIGKLVIVIIDDLDRLDKNEILSVLKLIRNSANFSNMAFVSAYDREYLTEVLKDTVYKGNIYLEKIFQYEYELPTYDKSKLKKLLYDGCDSFIENDEEKKNLKRIIYGQPLLHDEGYITDYIKNFRDVKRFINAFHTSYDKLKGEVLISDLLNLELLRLKYPLVYDLLAENHDKYLSLKNGHLVLEKESLDSKSHNLDKKDLIEYIKNKYNTDAFESIQKILNKLFKDSASSQERIKAISNRDYIQRYFYYALSDYDISEVEFNSIIGKSYDDIKKKIDEWVINQSRSLTILLTNYPINNDVEYKKIIKSIFYLGKKSEKWTLSVDEIKVIINKPPMKNSDEKKAFIKSVLLENDLSEFVVKFIHDVYLTEPHKWTFIIPQKDCKDICFNMFKNACRSNKDMDKIYYFYKYTKYTEYEKIDDNTYRPEYKHNEKADNLFFEYVKKNPSKILPSFINKSIYNNIYSIGSWVFDIWNNEDSFINFINSLPKNDNLISEFQDFMSKYFEKSRLPEDKKEPIPYEFKYLFNDDYLDKNSAKNE